MFNVLISYLIKNKGNILPTTPKWLLLIVLNNETPLLLTEKNLEHWIKVIPSLFFPLYKEEVFSV